MKYIKRFNEHINYPQGNYGEISKDDALELEIKSTEGDILRDGDRTKILTTATDLFGNNITEYSKKDGYRYHSFKIEYYIDDVKHNIDITKFSDEWFIVILKPSMYEQGRYLCDGIIGVIDFLKNAKEISTKLNNDLNKKYSKFNTIKENHISWDMGDKSYRQFTEEELDIIAECPEFNHREINTTEANIMDESINYIIKNNPELDLKSIDYEMNKDLNCIRRYKFDHDIQIVVEYTIDYYVLVSIYDKGKIRDYICDEIKGFSKLCKEIEIITEVPNTKLNESIDLPGGILKIKDYGEYSDIRNKLNFDKLSNSDENLILKIYNSLNIDVISIKSSHHYINSTISLNKRSINIKLQKCEDHYWIIEIGTIGCEIYLCEDISYIKKALQDYQKSIIAESTYYPEEGAFYKEISIEEADEILLEREPMDQRRIDMIISYLNECGVFNEPFVNPNKKTIIFNDKDYDGKSFYESGYWINIANDDLYSLTLRKNNETIHEYICDQITGLKKCIQDKIIKK